MEAVLMAIFIGLLAGAVHQVIDEKTDNMDGKQWARALILGIAASLLTFWQFGINTPVMLFVAGYMGDSVILNIIRHVKKIKG